MTAPYEPYNCYRIIAKSLIPTVVMMLIAGSSEPHAQGNSLEIAQLRCAALVAAVEKVPTATYLDQHETPGYFTMLRRHKPLFNKCMAVCDVPGATVACAVHEQSASVAARYQQLLNASAEDSIAKARERLRKGQ
jgi:hypothetical protein